MPFLDHLEQLRWVILKSLSALLLSFVATWAFTDRVYDLLMRPLTGMEEVKLVFSGPLEGVLLKLKLAMLGAFVLALPFILWFAWEFISPGLKGRERHLGIWVMTAGTGCFLVGAAFAYGVIPLSLRFLVSFGPSDIEQLWQVKSYIDFAFRLIVACGVLFELPLVMVLITRLGLVDVETLARGRPVAVVLAFTLAAILTPPDVITQLMLGIPLIGLFEVGLLLGRLQKPSKVGEP